MFGIVHYCLILHTSVCESSIFVITGDTTCGQRVLYQVGMTGIPIYNVSFTAVRQYELLRLG